MVQKLLFLPPLASAHGGALDRMTLWVHVLMLVLFVGWSIYFVIVLMRFSAAKNPKANPPDARTPPGLGCGLTASIPRDRRVNGR